MGIASEAQKIALWLQWAISPSISLSLERSGACYDRSTPAHEVCDENGHPPLLSVSSDSAFHIGFISEWSSVSVVYSGCGRRITSLWGRNLQSEGNYLRAADGSKCELKLALAGGKNWVTRQLAANFIRNRYITWFKSNCRIQINLSTVQFTHVMLESSPFRKEINNSGQNIFEIYPKNMLWTELGKEISFSNLRMPKYITKCTFSENKLYFQLWKKDFW